jgi:DNA polymerase III epsilon subunit family exonuclease
MDQPLVIIDTETATLRGAPHLLELGAILVVDGEIAERFEALVRPEVPVDPLASDFHGIFESMIVDAQPAASVLEQFSAWVQDHPLVAHNADFDGRVLAFEYSRARQSPPPGVLIDTLKLARKCLPESPDHKLQTLCEHLQLEQGTHHRALADAVWCWQVLEACLERMEPSPTTLAGLIAAAGASTSIADCQPRVRALLKQRHRPLEHAIQSREPVTLVYGETDTSPVPLSVLPRVLYDMGARSYLEAECLASGTIKTYRLDRVHKVHPRS